MLLARGRSDLLILTASVSAHSLNAGKSLFEFRATYGTLRNYISISIRLSAKEKPPSECSDTIHMK